MPPPLAGRTTIGVRFLWVGDAEEGAGLLDQIRAVAPVVIDDAALKPYTAVDSVHADPVDPMPVKEASMLLTDFPDDAVARFLDRVGPGADSPQIMAEIRQLGGAYARAGEHPSAFVHRNAAFSLLTVGIAFDPRVVPHAHDLISALSDWDTGVSGRTSRRRTTRQPPSARTTRLRWRIWPTSPSGTTRTPCWPPAPSCGRPRRKRQPDRPHPAQAGSGRWVGARFASDAPPDADYSSD